MTDQTAQTIYVAQDGTAKDRLERAAALVPRRRFFSDMPDKGLFVLVAVFGFGAISYSKLHGIDSDYVAFAAVAAMVAYGVAAFQLPRVRMRPDRLGDNFYYLGFIFTLASLSAALLQLKAGASLDDLLGGFGLALFSTIVGVAGRVLFVQMRGDLDDVEDDARRNLLNASADLRAQLSQTLAEFETFQTGIKQAAKASIEDSVDLHKVVTDKVTSAAETAARKIDAAFTREDEKVRVIEDGVARIATIFETLTIELQQRFDGYGDRLEKMASLVSRAVELFDRRAGRRRWYWPFFRI